MSFWTSDINSDEVQSPKEIMYAAGKELQTRTKKLSVSVRHSELKDRIVLAFDVSRDDLGVTVNLFEAAHQITSDYPVVIDPPNIDTPEFLMKERYVPASYGAFSGLATMAAAQKALQGTPAKYVENEWVCATPTEFRRKLTELFAANDVKSRIVSLLARAGASGSENTSPDS